MMRKFYHKRVEVVSIGPDGHHNQRAIYEVTGKPFYMDSIKGYGSTLEDAIIDAIRIEAAAERAS